MKKHTTLILPLLVLTILALVLRIWGLDFGLPYAEARPDEMIIIRQAFGYGTGDLNPHCFYYPSLFSYLVFFAYGVYALILLLTGGIQCAWDLVIRFAEDPTIFFLIPRMISALLGAVTVPAVYILAREVSSRRSAVISALLLSVCYLHVRESHFGVADTAMTAFVVLAAIPILSIVRKSRVRDYVVAGVLSGLATSLKYNAALLAIPVLVAHWCSCGMAGRGMISRILSRKLWIAALCMIGAFALTSPFVFLDWRAFARDFAWQMGHLGGAENVRLARGWIYFPLFSLRYGVGVLMLLLAGVGAIWCLWRKRKIGLVLLAFPLAYYLVMGSGYAVLARYVVPLVPFLCLFAGVAIGEFAFTWLRSLFGAKYAWSGLAALVVLVAAPSLCSTVRLDNLLSRDDTRELAVRYVRESLPAGSVIGWVGTRYGLPSFDQTPASVEKELEMVQAQGGSGKLHEARLAVVRKRGGGIEIEQIDVGDLENSATLPEYILVEYYPLAWCLSVTARAEKLLEKRGYRRTAVFSGASRRQLGDSPMKYDVQDSFYLPYVGLQYVTRPGPYLTLWHRTGPGIRSQGVEDRR